MTRKTLVALSCISIQFFKSSDTCIIWKCEVIVSSNKTAGMIISRTSSEPNHARTESKLFDVRRQLKPSENHYHCQKGPLYTCSSQTNSVKTNVFLKFECWLYSYLYIMIYGNPNISNVLFTNIYTTKFLNIVSDSTRLLNRIYGCQCITFPSFHPLLVFGISVVFNRVLIWFNFFHRQ